MNTATAAAERPALPVIERQGIVAWAAGHFGVELGKVVPILKDTCFKGSDGKPASDAEVAALLIVAREHKLNPFLREIYAFPAKGGGIVPIVGIDGWITIVNNHPMYNGCEFVYASGKAPEWVECHLFRKDRSHPIKVRELMEECRRDTMPWKSHPSRMLRHKAFIQCARVAFGFAGIYDPDEGEAIIDGQVTDAETTAQPPRGAAGLKQALGAPKGEGGGGASTGTTIDMSTGEVKENGQEPKQEKKPKPSGTLEQRNAFVQKMGDCKDTEILDLVADESRSFEWNEADQAVIDDAYRARMKALGGSAA